MQLERARSGSRPISFALIERRAAIEQHQENQPEYQPKLTLLEVMRGVESTPPGDLEWAIHCTRQQAVMLSLQLPGTEPPTLEQLAEVLGIAINVVPDLPAPSLSLTTIDRPPAIIIDGKQPSKDHLRLALREVKKVIDQTSRERMGVDAFPDEIYEQLDDAFAVMVAERSGWADLEGN